MNHSGCFEDLKTKIIGCGSTIKEVIDQEHGHQIKTNEGATITWYTGTGTLQIQGKKLIKDTLEEAWRTYNGIPSKALETVAPSPDAPVNPAVANKKVFVVHGHDTASREQLELVLHKLGLDPFVLANTSGGGLTIIEALEAEIGTNNDQARFGIVLMTPDDMGYSKSDGESNIQPRARQNVVLEMGMLISAVGRGNVAILRKGHIEEPSDASGILYIPFNDHVKEAVPKLADRLRAAGFVLNPENITKASS